MYWRTKWNKRKESEVPEGRIAFPDEEKMLVLTHSRYMSVSWMSFLTKQIHAERKWLAKEQSAWTEHGERNGPATANCRSGCGLDAEGSGHKQGRVSPCCLGHSWTLFCPLHCIFSQQKRWGIIAKLEMLHDGMYLVKAFVDPVYTLLICAVWWPGTISVVKTELHHFPAENPYLDEESNFSEPHNGAIGFALLMKNSEENRKPFSIHFSFFMTFQCIQCQEVFKGTFA